MAQEVEVITKDGEVVSGLPAGYDGGNQSLAVSLARAEVDQQIATARALPRSVSRAISNITSLATLDEQSAEECVYALPRGGKPIKGPSIRLAEIIAGQWGNCRVGARVVHVDRQDKFVEAEGVFHDLETNMATTVRVRRRIVDSKGRLYNDDMIVVTGNAACSIAKRNAILGAVPKGVWRKAYDAVEQVMAGDIKTLSERKEAVFKAFAAFGVAPEQLFAALGIGGADDINLDHMVTLTGMRSALKSGEETVETMFPKVGPAAGGDKRLSKADLIDRIAAGGKTTVTSGLPAKPKDKGPEPDPAAGERKAEPPTSQISDGEGASSGGPIGDDHGDDGGDADNTDTDAGDAGEDDDGAEIAALIKEIGETPSGIDMSDVSQVYSFRQGMLAAEKGVARKAIPGALRADDRQSEAAAWGQGHDLATARKRATKEG